jgi:hypothetical protein
MNSYLLKMMPILAAKRFTLRSILELCSSLNNGGFDNDGLKVLKAEDGDRACIEFLSGLDFLSSRSITMDVGKVVDGQCVPSKEPTYPLLQSPWLSLTM